MQLGRATYGGGRSGDGDSGLFTRVLYKSYLILLLKIGGELSAWDSVQFGSVRVLYQRGCHKLEFHKIPSNNLTNSWNFHTSSNLGHYIYRICTAVENTPYIHQ